MHKLRTLSKAYAAAVALTVAALLGLASYHWYSQQSGCLDTAMTSEHKEGKSDHSTSGVLSS